MSTVAAALNRVIHGALACLALGALAWIVVWSFVMAWLMVAVFVYILVA
jgi:hypothetical protein